VGSYIDEHWIFRQHADEAAEWPKLMMFKQKLRNNYVWGAHVGFLVEKMARGAGFLPSTYFWVEIAQWYSSGLRAGWSGIRIPVGAGNFSLHHRVQTGSGVRPASHLMDIRGSFPGGKAAGAWSWPLTSIYCRGQEWVDLYLHFPNTPSWRVAQL
jgi:hypothetical protein